MSFPVPNLNTLGSFVFELVINVKMHLVTLTFDLSTQNHVTSRISQVVCTMYQVWTLWDHLFLSYAPDKQTDKQTDGLKHPTHANRLSRRG